MSESDKKADNATKEVDEHPLNSPVEKKRDDDQDSLGSTSVIDLSTSNQDDEAINKGLDELSVKDLDIVKNDESTEAWKENLAEPTNNNHPLESVDSVEDPWAQQEDISLLDDHDNTPTPPPRPDSNVAQLESVDMQEVLDADTTHVKGFYNTEDSNEIVDLEVNGQLPDWLVCEHFTVGPGTYDIKYMRKMEIDGELQNVSKYFTFGHWFDGLPLVNRFDIHGQRNSISYRNRLTCHRLIGKIRDNHGYSPRHPAGLFKTSTNQTVLTKFIGGSGGGNKGGKADAEPCGARILANIPGLEGRLFCQNFANHVQELDPFDMKPTRLLTWNEINPAFKGYSSCPNGIHDRTTGEYVNFTMDVGYQSTRYNFFSISDGNPRGAVIGSISAPTSYVNSFAMTRSYIILVLFPFSANGMKYSWNESILDSFTFNSSQPTLFHVISRETGKQVARFRSPACFAFHHVNAFEDDSDNIYIDMICYPDDTIARQLTTESLRNPASMRPQRLGASEVRRYVLHTVTQTGSRQSGRTNNGNSGLFGAFKRSSAGSDNGLSHADYHELLQPSIELPQINPIYKMHNYTYLYGLGFSASSSIADGKIWDSIIKVNVNTRSVTGTWYEHGCYPSEAVFVPRPSTGPEDEVAEDDGVLLSIVMDSARATSFLLVLDAASLSVLAKAYLGTLVPLSFARGSYRLYTT
ncbi:retinal pigment epithelial membrane protein-domain-containing protein [Fennellomyces sp. T-0311]|nr:retinal pigment epithelial membrane protein-domain-containing protein [Fennellomyces sp. T-0311]